MSIPPPTPRICSDPTCNLPARSRGLCARHYGMARRAGLLPETWERRNDEHQLTLIDKEALTAACSICGPVQVRIKSNRNGYIQYQCRTKRRPGRREQPRNERRRNGSRHPRHLARYGLTLKDYLEILERQGNCCAICGLAFGTNHHIDHDHLTGVVRGILCRRCNYALGWLDDSPRKALAAYRYLKGSQGRIF